LTSKPHHTAYFHVPVFFIIIGTCYYLFFRVSSLAYPNLLGKKGYVVVVVVFIINPFSSLF